MANQFPLRLIQQAINSSSFNKKSPFESQPSTSKLTTSSIPDNVEETPTEKLPIDKLYITVQLPPEVAILHIYHEGTDKYVAWGGNAICPLRQTEAKQRPYLSLGELKVNQKIKPPGAVRDDMFYFSVINVEIRKWLKKIRQKFGEKMSLVIADYTNFEIPWEMLELSPDEQPNEFVGTLITTVRWRKVIRGDDYLELDFKSEECCGNILAYLLDTELKVEEELKVLEELQAVIYKSSQHHINEFQNHLQKDVSDNGLIYFSCHGNFAEEVKETSLGSGTNKEQQLKLTSLRRCRLNLIKNSQGIVFINACHSSREQENCYVPSEYRMSFIELFLAKGARGVIGTLGAVGDIYAAKFAIEIIKISINYPHLSVAAILKQLRLNVVKNLPENPTTEELLSFIYVFMYVYYGNPMTKLRLTSPGV